MKRRLIEGLASETIGTVRLSPRSSINVARCSLSCESNVCDVILRRKELPSELEHLSWAFRNKLKPVRFYLDFRICSAYNQAKKKGKTTTTHAPGWQENAVLYAAHAGTRTHV